jgi:predicted AlkP superfamily phosphohydrolase/phosphomutase
MRGRATRGAAIASHEDPMPDRKRLLLIGADAGAPQLFSQWAESGDLPTIARLWREGAWGPVRNPPGLEAGATWPVFHSGLLPGHQPQYDARRLFDPRDYSTRWFGPDETPPTFWRRLSDQGLRCVLLDPPYVHLDRALNGRMVVDWGGHVPADGRQFRLQTHPESLADEVLAAVGPDPAHGRSCDRWAPESTGDLRAFAARHYDRIARKGWLARHLLAGDDWDFALIAFGDLHCLGHHLWHVHDPAHPQHSPRLARALGDPLREGYRRFDRALGEILAEHPDTTVVLLGSHGMGPHYSATGLLDRILHALERGRPAPRARSLRGSLRALWHRVPADLRARLRPLRKPFAGLLHPPTFLPHASERRFFEVYANNAAGGIRLNLQGREARGRVAPQEAGALLAWLRDELRRVVNAETGEPLVDEVVFTHERYPGPHAAGLPDLLAVWNRRAPIRVVSSPAIGTLMQETVEGRTGDHTADGVFLARGPGVRARGRIDGVQIADFAPTIAAWFERDIGPGDGREIPGLLAGRVGTREAA